LMSTFTRSPETLSMNALSVLLIGPYEERRQKLSKLLAGPQANVVKEFAEYPSLDDLSQILDGNCDVVVMDLDTNPEQALDLVESICSTDGSVTVMVYSSQADPELLMRCMRAGAREFLAEPMQPSTVAEALVRASARRQEVRRPKKVAGKLFTFVGAKGGSGVTTIASNFAIALAKECGKSVVLVDLDLQLGDAALGLGISSQFSVLDALQNVSRLDSDLLSSMLAKHSSGLTVLAAPDKYTAAHAPQDSLEKLLNILRGDFPYVVVDLGSGLTQNYRALFEMADLVYLVAQVNVPELRNAHRLVSEYFNSVEESKLEVVLNRFLPRGMEIDENSINKALLRPAKWKVPNDYQAVRRAQNTASPLALEDTPISRAIYEIARAACGRSLSPGKKKKFGLFG
jgi:pilus assembly protein CpaE